MLNTQPQSSQRSRAEASTRGDDAHGHFQPVLRGAGECPGAEAADPYAELGTLFKAFAEPLRLHILRVLHKESLAVSELCILLQMRQNALSHHLKVLTAVGLISSRREGNNIFYRRSEALGLQTGAQPGPTLLHALLAELDSLPLPAHMQTELAALYRSRERNSEAFFRNNAHKFRAQQDLIASYEQYADTVASLLYEAPLPGHRLALEVGPGDGRFLPVLAALFEHVVAVDNSAQMLEASRDTARSAGLDSVRFVLGDTRCEELRGLRADVAVVNMVLHHTPDPAQVLADVAACLAPGGLLLLSELCSHDQAWARENCGDLWLGFDPDELGAWAHAAGLKDLASSFLAQRNGFQVQVRLFRRPATRPDRRARVATQAEVARAEVTRAEATRAEAEPDPATYAVG